MRKSTISLCMIALLAGAVPVDAAQTPQQQAARRVADNMKQSGLLKDYAIGVKYRDGVAHLMGTVTSERQKELAERIARTSEGVRDVVSNLDVIPPEGGSAASAPSGNLANQPARRQQVRNDRQVTRADMPANIPPLPKQVPPAFSAAAAQRGAAPMPYAASRVRDVHPAQFARQQAMQQARQQARQPARPMPPRGRGVQRVNYAPQAPQPMAGHYRPQGRANGPIRPVMNANMGGPAPAYAGGYGGGARPIPTSHIPGGIGRTVSYDNPQMPGYAWPSYAASPNYAALTYPRQYSPSAWPYIGPFYPYPQVPLGWRKVTLEWDDGWWFLDFKDSKHCCCK